MQPQWEEAFKDRTAAELDELFGRHNAGVTPYNTYSGLMDWPQAMHLHIFRKQEHPTAGSVTITGSAWTYSVTPEDVTRRPAPLLGQHTHEVLDALVPGASSV
jgi:crotonobetainyl-CoA:carnitine CoA-transferase CaiB-like acyl-CoA transferase